MKKLSIAIDYIYIYISLAAGTRIEKREMRDTYFFYDGHAAINRQSPESSVFFVRAFVARRGYTLLLFFPSCRQRADISRATLQWLVRESPDLMGFYMLRWKCDLGCSTRRAAPRGEFIWLPRPWIDAPRVVLPKRRRGIVSVPSPERLFGNDENKDWVGAKNYLLNCK